MTRGHNIVADGWAGAANPHPHPTLHPTPLLTQTHTQKASKTLIFPLFDSCTRTDRWMDRRTDGWIDGRTKPLVVVCPRLKIERTVATDKATDPYPKREKNYRDFDKKCFF